MSDPASSLSSHPYLTRQLIAYIGNKRTLLGFLKDVFRNLGYGPGTRFLDPFCGSGSVSRLGRLLGYRVAANDWEPYAALVTEAHTAYTSSEVQPWFSRQGGWDRVVAQMQAPPPSPGYLSRYYAPATLEGADWNRERMFYTPRNAEYLDRARSLVEDWYPGWDLPEELRREKVLLTAPLLYLASAHANTSGVFKAFHKGFGGHGGDALKRILHPMIWEPPVLLEEGPGAGVFRSDAAQFLAGRTGDLIYLDPPYNQHQYGSNYHLLNTIALWDKPEAPLDLKKGGVLRNKAGIRPDWIQRRSPWCQKTQAPLALENLLDKADARHIVLSYNTEGIIPFDQLVDILSRSGRVEMVIQPYVKYRGGRQSPSRAVHNAELALILDRSGSPARGDVRPVKHFLLARKVRSLLSLSFHPERLYASGLAGEDGTVVWKSPGRRFETPTLGLWKLLNPPEDLEDWPTEELERLAGDFEPLICRNYPEEAQVLMDLLERPQTLKDRRLLASRLLWALRKFAFKKYQQEFTHSAARAKAVLSGLEGGSKHLSRLEALETQAGRRFSSGISPGAEG